MKPQYGQHRLELVSRKKMVSALATYALEELRGDDVSARRLKIARQVL